ncbi:MAG: choice-of-anchor D domain-containing protein [Lutibacter sp.]|uniref:LamG-like jellyroll fold domain-containing protein n=1 Tax=Lutibacter sp. TaxID=1925666 RepID=UPI00385F4875
MKKLILYFFIFLFFSAVTYSQTVIHTADFESSLDGWTQSSSDDFDWTIQSGGTPSSGTGPNLASLNSWYLYAEMSSPRATGDVTIITSPTIDLTSYTSPTLTFDYHMYSSNFSSDVGTLDVEINVNGGGWTTNIFSKIGSQNSSQSSWITATIDLTAYQGNSIQLRVIATRAGSWRGDIAFDNVKVTGFLNNVQEMDITGLGNAINDGDTTPTTTDDTNFGSVNVSSAVDHTFTIKNLGNSSTTLNLTGAPIVAISGNAAFTVLTQPSSNSIIGGNSLTFIIRFSPIVISTVTTIISIDNDDSNEDPYNFTIEGTGVTPLTAGPGGITSDLKLWLKANDGLAYSDGQSISLWSDQGRGSNATVNTAGQEPTYRDNVSYNVNFNPVVDFDNSYNPVAVDDDFSFDDTSTQFLEGVGGLYTQDIFVVLIPDVTVNSTFGSMDIFCGDEDITSDQTDATGIGLGAYTARFSSEILCYAVGTTSSGDGYGVAEIGTGNTYSNVGILNARNNVAVSQQELYYNANNIGTNQNDIADFSNINNSRYWIGRSEGWEASTDARIAEIITYSSRQDDATERNKIEGYLAIKYGITLGINGASQDYVDSAGNVIWDVLVNTGFNYDIAGIGQDDDSELNQKQSKSVNSGSIVAIGLGEVTNTNNANLNSFSTNLDFLVWGRNSGNFNTSAEVAQSINLSNSTTTFTPVSRKWKILETQNDVPEVVISIVTSDLTSNIPLAANEEYMLVVSDNSNFNPSDIIDVVPLTTNGTNSEAWYDFDGTKYFTIAKATRVVEKRRVDFTTGEFLLGDNNLELTTNFTVSAWVKNNSNGGSFISKGNGYNFKINGSNQVEIDWNGATKVTSTNTIDSNWHHVALTYSGGTATLYIDGILDITVSSLANPTSSTNKFTIGALYTNKTTVSSFDGAIDEVRLWNAALTITEIRYIMNQEIEEFSTNVDGEILPQSITKNDISSRAWSTLQAYYDMNSFYGTTIEDNSNNKNWVRIKYLTKDKQLVENQTAPLPYESTANGNWDTAATWLNNTVQYLPNTTLNGTVVDWNIVETNNNVNTTRNITVLGLKNNSNELSINADNSLTVSHYLLVNGFIDFDGESQLIQTEGSDLDEDSGGYIERDQQGTANSFNYNYWASSVGAIGTGAGSNNANYALSGILEDGTDDLNPGVINFQASYTAADTGVTSPIVLSSYWFYTFNGTSNDYNSWTSIDENTPLKAGEGYTMKGSSGNLPIITNQNYVFKGKPNNGDITLPIAVGNDRLIGNPYASAIDADEFIKDNIKETINSKVGRNIANVFNGALYFWHHFGEENSHNLKDYVGGYATYTLMGGTQAISNDSRINDDLSTGGKVPERYIPVGQGFFVNAYLPSSLSGTTATIDGGNIVFKNSQRIFKVEGSNAGNGSVFFKTSSKNSNKIPKTNTDSRSKIRLIFDSPTGYHRQLLIGTDQNASNKFDMGYDAPIADIGNEDMFWVVDEAKFVIQAVTNFNKDQEFPIGIKIESEGKISIKIDTLENINENTSIYIKDNLTGETYNIKKYPFEVNLAQGEYLDRFTLVFQPRIKTLKEVTLDDGIFVYMNNKTSELHVKRIVDTEIHRILIFNYLGQIVATFSENFNEREFSIPLKKISGVYIVQLETINGTISQKILIN